MGVKRCKEGRRVEESAEDRFPTSARFLMSRSFLLILLNMLFGLLPVTISGNKVRHSHCSLSTLFSIGSALSLVFLSYVFAPLAIMTFMATPGRSSTDVLAIGILKASHIAGFMLLIFNSHRVARKLPPIWKNLVRCFHFAVVDVYGDKWPPLRKLSRFTFLTFFIYLSVLVVSVFTQAGATLQQMMPLFYRMVTPLDNHGASTNLVIVGYVIWDMAALSHVLVSMILTLFVLVIILCLKSVNLQLEELVERESGRDLTSSFWYEDKERLVWAKLDRFKMVYGLCEDITGALSKSWGLPLIVESIVLIGNTLVNTFFVFGDLVLIMSPNGSGMRRYSGYNDYLTLIASSLIHFYFLFKLSTVASKMVRESKKPLRILKNMSDRNESIYTRSKIASFKVDVAEADIRLSAGNYFQVNKFLITSLVGSLTTYLIVLMQFKQQDSLDNGNEQDLPNCTLSSLPTEQILSTTFIYV